MSGRDERDPDETQDWSRYDPTEHERGGARDLRDAVREAQRAAHDAAREAARALRDAEREARRAERRSRRIRVSGHGLHISGLDIDGMGIGDLAKRFMGDVSRDADGESYSETIQETFAFERMPRLRVRNISGETKVHVGDAAGTITVIATKRVSATSEDRAKRLLQNLEVRLERSGDELRVEPHLYEQERGWVDLFRGKRFRVDFDITVPRECAIDAHTVSGDLDVRGTRGPLELQSVSGEIALADAEGPLRLKSVSGDVEVRAYVGHVEGNSVSGDLVFDTVRVRSMQLHTVSGDVELKGVLEAAREHRFRTISGDVELSLVDPDLTVDFRTASGDLESDGASRVTRHGRKEFAVALGQGRGHVVVKTVSGDLTLRGASQDVPGVATTDAPFVARTDEGGPEPEGAQDFLRTEPMDTPASDEVRRVLERLAKGELNVDDAASALDAARRAR